MRCPAHRLVRCVAAVPRRGASPYYTVGRHLQASENRRGRIALPRPLPSRAKPRHALPGHAMPSHAVHRLAMYLDRTSYSGPAIRRPAANENAGEGSPFPGPCHAKPCQALPGHAVPYPAGPCRAVPRRALPSRASGSYQLQQPGDTAMPIVQTASAGAERKCRGRIALSRPLPRHALPGQAPPRQQHRNPHRAIRKAGNSPVSAWTTRRTGLHGRRTMR